MNEKKTDQPKMKRGMGLPEIKPLPRVTRSIVMSPEDILSILGQQKTQMREVVTWRSKKYTRICSDCGGAVYKQVYVPIPNEVLKHTTIQSYGGGEMWG